MVKFKNTVTVAGTLVESNLTQGTGVDSGRDYYRGNVSIQTAENNVVKVQIFQMFDKKDKAKQGSFIPDNRYKDVAKLADPATIGTNVQISASFANNIFVNGEGETVKSVNVDGGFYRIPHAGAGKADFSATMVIRSVQEELDRDTQEPTGSVVVKGETFAFNGTSIPVQFYVDNSAGAKYFLDMDVSEPILTEVWGKIENSQLPPKTVESAFGEAQVIESTFTRTRRVITGAAVEPHEVDEEIAGKIREGKQAYEVAIADAEAYHKTRQESNSAFNNGDKVPASSDAGASKPKTGGFNF